MTIQGNTLRFGGWRREHGAPKSSQESVVHVVRSVELTDAEVEWVSDAIANGYHPDAVLANIDNLDSRLVEV